MATLVLNVQFRIAEKQYTSSTNVERLDTSPVGPNSGVEADVAAPVRAGAASASLPRKSLGLGSKWKFTCA